MLGFLSSQARHPLKMTIAISLEAMARAYSSLYVWLDKGDRAVWKQVSSTKDLLAEKP
jgi:hypothetical protein